MGDVVHSILAKYADQAAHSGNVECGFRTLPSVKYPQPSLKAKVDFCPASSRRTRFFEEDAIDNGSSEPMALREVYPKPPDLNYAQVQFVTMGIFLYEMRGGLGASIGSRAVIMRPAVSDEKLLFAHPTNVVSDSSDCDSSGSTQSAGTKRPASDMTPPQQQ